MVHNRRDRLIRLMATIDQLMQEAQAILDEETEIGVLACAQTQVRELQDARARIEQRLHVDAGTESASGYGDSESR